MTGTGGIAFIEASSRFGGEVPEARTKIVAKEKIVAKNEFKPSRTEKVLSRKSLRLINQMTPALIFRRRHPVRCLLHAQTVYVLVVVGECWYAVTVQGFVADSIGIVLVEIPEP